MILNHSFNKNSSVIQVGWIIEYGNKTALALEVKGFWTYKKMNFKYSLKQTEIFAEKI